RKPAAGNPAQAERNVGHAGLYLVALTIGPSERGGRVVYLVVDRACALLLQVLGPRLDEVDLEAVRSRQVVADLQGHLRLRANDRRHGECRRHRAASLQKTAAAVCLCHASLLRLLSEAAVSTLEIHC